MSLLFFIPFSLFFSLFLAKVVGRINGGEWRCAYRMGVNEVEVGCRWVWERFKYPQAPTNWFTSHNMEASPLTHGGFASTHESIMRPEKNKSEKAFGFLWRLGVFDIHEWRVLNTYIIMIPLVSSSSATYPKLKFKI